MLFKLENINVELSEKIIFEDLNLVFNIGDKIGIVGDNGQGKSTLLKLIVGNIKFSGNKIINNLNYGYLSQDESLEELELENIRKKELEEKLANQEIIDNAEEYERILEEYTKIVSNGILNKEEELLKAFNFDKERFLREKKSSLSGGEATKLKLIKLLAQNFDFYLFDEPTNHLDVQTKEKLVEYFNLLKSFMVVSHDVELLNKTCNKIFYIKNKKAKLYYGNYDEFIKQKEKEEELIKLQMQKQEHKKNKLELQIQSIKSKTNNELSKKSGPVLNNLGTGRGSAEAAISKAQKLIRKKEDEIENFDNIDLEKCEFIRINKFVIEKSYTQVLNLKNIFVKRGNFELNIKNLEIKKGEKVALLGKNGSGKSTLLDLIRNKIDLYNGDVELGQNVKIGYLSQKNENLQENNTIIKELEYLKMDETVIRKALGNFLFRKNKVFKKIKVLSGGEKNRLSLLKLMLEGCNFLLLDEPTNHLDIQSKQLLAQALAGYQGTLLVVSHDMDFIEKFVTRKDYIDNL